MCHLEHEPVLIHTEPCSDSPFLMNCAQLRKLQVPQTADASEILHHVIGIVVSIVSHYFQGFFYIPGISHAFGRISNISNSPSKNIRCFFSQASVQACFFFKSFPSGHGEHPIQAIDCTGGEKTCGKQHQIFCRGVWRIKLIFF